MPNLPTTPVLVFQLVGGHEALLTGTAANRKLAHNDTQLRLLHVRQLINMHAYGYAQRVSILRRNASIVVVRILRSELIERDSADVQEGGGGATIKTWWSKVGQSSIFVLLVCCLKLSTMRITQAVHEQWPICQCQVGIFVMVRHTTHTQAEMEGAKLSWHRSVWEFLERQLRWWVGVRKTFSYGSCALPRPFSQCRFVEK